MHYAILPSLIATQQEELQNRFQKVQELSQLFHLDIMDGHFVSNTSLWFDFRLPGDASFEAHLMATKPEEWIEEYASLIRKLNAITFHVEANTHPEQTIKQLQQHNLRIGLAMNPNTSVSDVLPYLSQIHTAHVMTVRPGQYGAAFIHTHNTIQQIRQTAPALDITVDGHVTPDTIGHLSHYGANRFVVGSYLQESTDVEQACKELKQRLNHKQ